MKSTKSASCSIAPDSLRSESTGFLPSRCSTCRDSWERAKTGKSRSLARILRARYPRYFLLTILSPCVPHHQLKVVNDDQSQVLLSGLQTPGLGPDLHHVDGSRIIYVDGSGVQGSTGSRELTPSGSFKRPMSEPVAVHAGFSAHHPLHKLHLGHFQTEDGHALLLIHGHVPGYVQR